MFVLALNSLETQINLCIFLKDDFYPIEIFFKKKNLNLQDFYFPVRFACFFLISLVEIFFVLDYFIFDCVYWYEHMGTIPQGARRGRQIPCSCS